MAINAPKEALRFGTVIVAGVAPRDRGLGVKPEAPLMAAGRRIDPVDEWELQLQDVATPPSGDSERHQYSSDRLSAPGVDLECALISSAGVDRLPVRNDLAEFVTL